MKTPSRFTEDRLVAVLKHVPEPTAEPMSTSEIHRAYGIDTRPVTHDLLRELEKRGFVVRTTIRLPNGQPCNLYRRITI